MRFWTQNVDHLRHVCGRLAAGQAYLRKCRFVHRRVRAPEAPLEKEREITLDVMLTIDGQQYSLDVTVTLPPEEEEPEAPPKEPEGPEEP